MGAACGTYGGDKRCMKEFGVKTWGEIYHSDDLGVYGRIALTLWPWSWTFTV